MMDTEKLNFKKNLLELAYIEEGKIRLSLSESIGNGPIAFYQETEIALDEIDGLVKEIIHYLNKINTLKNTDYKLFNEFQKSSQLLYNELLSQEIKIKLQNTPLTNLELVVDAQLVHIPWELLFDGQRFLCEQFSIGRQVRTKENKTFDHVPTVPSTSELRMLIIADPLEDLDIALEEGTHIYNEFQSKEKRVKVVLQTSAMADIEFVKKNIWDYDIVHYAGHAEYDSVNPHLSGWILSDGTLNSSDILKMAGSKRSMPVLVFGNACQSGFTEKWHRKKRTSECAHESYGLVHAFLMAGVQHYIGAFCDVSNEYSVHIGIAFYHYLLEGNTIGESLRKARESFKKKFGAKSFSWINYMLYGHPEDCLIHIEDKEKYQEGYNQTNSYESDTISLISRGNPRESQPNVTLWHFFQSFSLRKKRIRKAFMILVLLIIITLGISLKRPLKGLFHNGNIRYLISDLPSMFRNSQNLYHENNALILYEEGKFKEAMKACKLLEENDSFNPLPYLLKGNICLAEGKLTEAGSVFQQALQLSKLTNIQQAHAFIGLGRIESLKKNKENALAFYKKATMTEPNNEIGYLSQAFLLDAYGEHSEALDHFEKIRTLTPDDYILSNLINEVKAKAKFSQEIAKFEQEKDKREYIDRLIKELNKQYKESSSLVSSWDNWTSHPLTLWLMKLEVCGHGYPLWEGQGNLLISGISEHITEYCRVKLVERAILDKLLEELTRGLSVIIDSNKKLEYGKMLPAKLIMYGQLIYTGPHIQLSLHLTETETSEIPTTINKIYRSTVSIAEIAEDVSKTLADRLKNLYPLRGRIVEIKGETITLNIGQMAGVRIGKQFQVIDREIVDEEAIEAILEIISATPDRSLAKIIKGAERKLKRNVCVQELGFL